eukprot:758933-Hanusia_phi.AAC.1
MTCLPCLFRSPHPSPRSSLKSSASKDSLHSSSARQAPGINSRGLFHKLDMHSQWCSPICRVCISGLTIISAGPWQFTDKLGGDEEKMLTNKVTPEGVRWWEVMG